MEAGEGAESSKPTYHPRPRTTFRRKKAAKGEMELDGYDPGDGTSPQPSKADGWAIRGAKEDVFLIVDGYNVCGSWDNLREFFVGERVDLEAARTSLVRSIGEMCGVRRWRAVVIFDAAQAGFDIVSGAVPTSPDLMASRSSAESTRLVEVHYTGNADAWIERKVGSLLREEGWKGLVLLATDDRTQRNVAEGYGAFCMGTEALQDEVNRAKAATREALRRGVGRTESSRSKSKASDPVGRRRAKAPQKAGFGQLGSLLSEKQAQEFDKLLDLQVRKARSKNLYGDD